MKCYLGTLIIIKFIKHHANTNSNFQIDFKEANIFVQEVSTSQVQIR